MTRKPCEHHISKTHEGNFTQFGHPILVTVVYPYVFIEMLIDKLLGSKSQRSKSQQAMTQNVG